MNAAFDPWRLVNTYGAFGDVGTKRFEPIISLTDGNTWYEIDFPCKPGNTTRIPCFCAPYHYRLDWNIWFIGFPPHYPMLEQRERWLFTFIQQLLTASGDNNKIPKSLQLLDTHSVKYLFKQHQAPFFHQSPVAAKVDMYHYQMANDLFTILFRTGKRNSWWNRTFTQELVPPLTLLSPGGGTHQLVRWSPPLNPNKLSSSQQPPTQRRLQRLQEAKEDASIRRVSV
eukprot:CAMPEP_0197303492 /NCGR_PEP_ID=MMETSP0890-20130614/51690_1 /TAXON_ID=44058 ORGANISM="Aureoumbra lagunensis, Strain CCMP1510" /NCGR_SAMPLE_ID=MMETSP0890 /ASSEMBLY_ACC=CAM_ASM_000533 /LENGTH=226 /DNA_ID=CAMNT_0042783321 /DNA_START=1161 /DNA_END=1841 /DNA_ORIENTATION=+